MRNGSLGDVVTSLEGKKVRTGADLFRLLGKCSPGDTVPFNVLRPKSRREEGVEEVVLNVTLTGSPMPQGLEELTQSLQKLMLNASKNLSQNQNL